MLVWWGLFGVEVTHKSEAVDGCDGVEPIGAVGGQVLVTSRRVGIESVIATEENRGHHLVRLSVSILSCSFTNM